MIQVIPPQNKGAYRIVVGTGGSIQEVVLDYTDILDLQFLLEGIIK